MGATGSYMNGSGLDLDTGSIRFDPNTYRITSLSDRTSLDVCGHGSENGAKIITYQYNGGKNQRWKARLHAGGIVLSSEEQGEHPFRARCIQQSVGHGRVELFDYTNKPSQKWYLEEVEPRSGKFIIRSLINNACLQNNGHGKQVTVAFALTASARHVWKIEKIGISGTPGGLISPGLELDAASIKFDPNAYKISSDLDGTSLDICGNGTGNRTKIITYEHNGGGNQRWKARLHAGGIIFSTEQQGFDPQNAKGIQQVMGSGAVELYDYMNVLNQKWYLEEVDPYNRKFAIRSLANNACLQNNGYCKQVTAVQASTIFPRHVWRIDRI